MSNYSLPVSFVNEEIQRTLFPHVLKWHTDLRWYIKKLFESHCWYWAFITQSIGSSVSIFTCDVEILDWSWRAVRSEEDTLAGAPRWSRMLTFLSLSAREIARGDVLPKSILCKTLRNHIWSTNSIKFYINSSQSLGQWTHQSAGLVR